jgi:hypothetical protein
VLDLRDYQLDPTLKHNSERLPGDPFGLIVDSVWCHTLCDPARPAITEVELIHPPIMNLQSAGKGNEESSFYNR